MDFHRRIGKTLQMFIAEVMVKILYMNVRVVCYIIIFLYFHNMLHIISIIQGEPKLFLLSNQI